MASHVKASHAGDSTNGPVATPIKAALAHDKNMAAEFLAVLDPAADNFTFQLFSDSGDGYAEIFHGSLDEVWPKVEALNTSAGRIGVFVTINQTDLQGRRTENIKRARALFADADGLDQIERSREVMRTSGATPTMVVRSSPGRAHFYWCCDDLPLGAFPALQSALIQKLGTDPAVKDLPRVMRLPGTLHLKEPGYPRKVTFKVFNSQPWKADELATQLGLSAPSNAKERARHTNNHDLENSNGFTPAEAERLRRIFGLPALVRNEFGAGLETNLEEIRSAVAAIPASAISTEHDWVKFTRGLAHEARVYEGQAEQLWEIVDAASRRAPRYDQIENRKRWLRYVDEALDRANPITIATVFDLAKQHGWSGWSPGVTPGTVQGVTPASNLPPPNVAIYTPGNEEGCRRLLDEVVAADARTFTLGDRAGPLVILRVPDEDTVPLATRWDSDLPGATLAMPADIMQRAERLTWQVPKSGKLVRSHPPRGFVGDYLLQMRGQYGAPPLRGIVRVSPIDDDGEIRLVSGYDLQSGLYHDRAPIFDLPQDPSREDVREAEQALLHPYSKYRFENDAAGPALILAAIFTAIERPFLAAAPMFVVRSSMPGTGKGLIVRSLVRLAFDTVPVVITWGGTGEEFEKRFAALLLQAPGALSIDNANGMQIQGDLLEAFITEGCADIRPLGRSEMVKVRSRSFITLTGNNPVITGDMARRTLVLDILPRSADPERDQYNFNPVEVVRERRTDFLRAAYTIMRAFRRAGMPSQRLPAVGSFDEWSRKVRDLVCWVQGYDISEAFRRNKDEDPRRQGDASLLSALFDHFGKTPFKSSEVNVIYERVADYRRSPHTRPTLSATEQALHAALDDVLGSRNVNAKLFGYWARRVKGARLGAFVLSTQHDTATNANTITVQRM